MKVKTVIFTVALGSLVIAAGAMAAASTAKSLTISRQAPYGDDTQVRTFAGTVWMNGGKFVLRVESEKAWYQLDAQKWASMYEGKQVRVTGTLDAPNKAIRVRVIEEDRRLKSPLS